MAEYLPIIQLALSIILIVLVLIQQRGASAGSAFGSSDLTYTSRRGAERWIFIATIIVAVLFFLSAAAHLFAL